MKSYKNVLRKMNSNDWAYLEDTMLYRPGKITGVEIKYLALVHYTLAGNPGYDTAMLELTVSGEREARFVLYGKDGFTDEELSSYFREMARDFVRIKKDLVKGVACVSDSNWMYFNGVVPFENEKYAEFVKSNKATVVTSELILDRINQMESASENFYATGNSFEMRMQKDAVKIKIVES